MNELTTNTAKKFENKGLQKATDRINKIGENVTKSLYEVAHIVAEVDANKFYLDDGYKNVHEWTKDAFGIAKSASYNMLAIGRDYTKEITNGKTKVYRSNLTEDNEEDFSTTQITKLLPVPREKVDELVRFGVIVPSMTVKEIDEVLKALKNDEDEEIPDDDDIIPDDDDDVIEAEAEEIPSITISKAFAMEIFKEISKGKSAKAKELTEKLAEALEI